MADSSIQNFIVKGGLEVADSAIFSGDVVIDSSANLTLNGGVSRCGPGPRRRRGGAPRAVYEHHALPGRCHYGSQRPAPFAHC